MNFRLTASPASRLLAAALLAAALAMPAGAGTDAADFQQAIKLFKQTRWAAAYGRFSELADRGHSEAARIALFMVRYGNPLYGSSWSATQEQMDSWIFAASRNPVRLDLSGGD